VSDLYGGHVGGRDLKNRLLDFNTEALGRAVQPLWAETSLLSLDALFPGHGNKAYKLRPLINEAKRLGHRELVTVGGAWSNHLWSLAKLACEVGLAGTAYVRGEPGHGLTPALEDVAACGFNIHFVSRAEYRQRQDPQYVARLLQRHAGAFWIPEGGSHPMGIQGAEQLGQHVLAVEPSVAHVVLAMGTGGTLAGLIRGLAGKAIAHGIAVTKGDDRAADQVDFWVGNKALSDHWQIHLDFHWGGYAKCPKLLMEYLLEAESRYGIELEPIYVAKALWAAEALRASGAISGRTMVIHTGGLQGRRGFAELKGVVQSA